MDALNLLGPVDADEVSPVFRGANRKGVVLKGDEVAIDAEVADILAVPWDHEGAMVDALRKGDADEVVMKSSVAAMRLLNGIAPELPDEIRESVEKLGRELYEVKNRKLNTDPGTGNGGELVDEESNDDDLDGGASGAPKDGSARDGELIGSGAGAKVNKDGEPNDYVCKKDYSAEQRRAMAAKGHALPDGSYPIEDKEDLSDAIHAIGRGKNNPKSKIRAHIKARAKALGAGGMIPATWVQKEDEGALQQALDTITKAFRRRSQDTRPSDADDPDNDNEPDNDPDDTNVNKGGDTVAESTVAVPIAKEDGTWDLTGVPDEAKPFYESMIEKQDRTEKDLKEAREEIAKAHEEIRSSTIVQKAEEFKFVAPADELTAVLKEAGAKLDPETVEKLETILGTANERLEKSGLFTELGKTHGEQTESAGDAWSQIEKMAAERVEKSDEPLSTEQAIDRVLKSAEGKKLYRQYLAENPRMSGGVS